ncbi:MAG: hypothetical protein JSS20_04085 [Proteobacteria bacterium]|nr:hypothetical protein [Pseudomonadota bacterium]
MLYWRNLDASVAASSMHQGIVSYVGPLQGRYQFLNARGNVQVDVTLDDKRVAHLTIATEKAPRVGDHLDVAEKIHGSGRHSFAWR